MNILFSTLFLCGTVSLTLAEPPARAVTPVHQNPHRVLFLCTGNYYRSRLAEAVFNYEAERAGLDWRATSRGLRTNLLSAKERRTRISHFTTEKLDELRIPRTYASPDPRGVTRADMSAAGCVIALSEREHKPYLEADFAPTNAWPLTYWNVDDVDKAPAKAALGIVTREVRKLVSDLKTNPTPSACRQTK